MPQYYKETIYAWFDLKEKNEGNSVFNFQYLDVKNEDLWLNSNVKDHYGKIIFFKRWYDAGILKVDDIVKDHELMSLKEIEFLFDKKCASLFHEYNTVINAIPKSMEKSFVYTTDQFDAFRRQIINEYCFEE